MQYGLSDTEIIRLHRELMAPIAVHQILKGHDELDETALYTLDVMISEYQPDTALLCIALCAAHIAERHNALLPIAASLGMEASRIVHEVGPVWLANADRHLGPAQEGLIVDLLTQMPEDFEALADLLDAVRAHLVETTDSAVLCDVLSQNAQGFMDYLDQQAEDDKNHALKNPAPVLEVHGNVITFPKMARAPF